MSVLKKMVYTAPQAENKKKQKKHCAKPLASGFLSNILTENSVGPFRLYVYLKLIVTLFLSDKSNEVKQAYYCLTAKLIYHTGQKKIYMGS